MIDLQSVWLFPQVRFVVKVRKEHDHQYVLQEAHDQQEIGVVAVLHEQRSSKVHKEDEELQLEGGRRN